MIEGIHLDAGNMSAVAILIVVFFMVMRGTLATPAHQRVLMERIKFLENLAVNQADAVKMSAKNAGAVEQVGVVVDHTFDAITKKAEESS